ncbi:MAG: hypothetical protein LBH04_01525 [Tannerellaceae bacterium]|nr:hypothetical protein [Tannerellaceae bacterium]
MIRSINNIEICLSTFIIISCTASIDIKTSDSTPVVSIYGCFTDELKQQSVTVFPFFSILR